MSGFYVRRDAFAAAENNVRQLVDFLFLLQQVNCVEWSISRTHGPHQLFTITAVLLSK